MEVYLDNSATTKVKKEVIDTMAEVMESCYGNPSSLHRKGVEAEKIVKDARGKIGSELCVPPEEVYFTSCGSESNNLAIIGTALAMRTKGEIITTTMEHKSVSECFSYLEQCGFTVRYVSPEAVVDAVNQHTQLVSVMHVNNEVGTVFDIAELNRQIKQKNPSVLLHTDAVQAFGKLDFQKNMADMISISAHKIGGPKGVGAVYIKKGIKALPVIYGGGQETGLRSGTENVPGIAGFGKALELIDKKAAYAHVQQLKDTMAGRLTETVDRLYINSPENSSPYILNVAMEGLRSEILLHSLEQKGVYVSSGSACSSNRPKPSHVLTAMGFEPKRVDSSVRISFCSDNTMEEIEYACEAFLQVAKVNEKIRNLK